MGTLSYPTYWDDEDEEYPGPEVVAVDEDTDSDLSDDEEEDEEEEEVSMSLFYSGEVGMMGECDWRSSSEAAHAPLPLLSFRKSVFGGCGGAHCSTSPRGGRMSFWKKCLVLVLLQIGCLAAIEHSTRGLAYEEDQIRLILGHQFPTKPITERLSEEESESEPRDGVLSFHPKVFNFKESAVGIPRLGIVRVDNRLVDENLKLISISGSTVHFHSSFFADKVISPGGNTTFEVVFLSRTEGHAVSNLYIHTSKGLFKYKVEGFGLPNPYRLRSVVSARIPLNGTYEPLITMHNPHETRIQVVEMLSSVADFHLELPDDLSEEWEGSAWAIEPFQTKPVMKGCFHGKTEGNHTGYIKIRVNSTTLASEYLLVPVEVQVSSAPGIYSQQDSLDFGLLVRTDKPKTLSLSLINAQTSPVNVQSVSVKGDPNSAVRIEFRPLVLEADSSTSIVVALVTFDPSEIRSLRETQGLIEIQSDSSSIIIPFKAAVIQGELEYNASSLGFFIKAEHVPLRNFSVRNSFPTTMAIYHVSVSHPEIVSIERFNSSKMLSPGEQKDVFSMRVTRQSELCESASEVQLTLKSNITNLKLPITCYDGKLQLYTAEPGQIDFGRVELYSSHTDYFSVDNSNPVEIRLKSWGSNSTWTQIELVGMRKGQKEDLTKIQDFDSLKKSLFIQPGHLAVFSIEIRRPTVEGIYWGETFVTSDHNQTLRLPFRFAVSKGSIHSESISFDKAFPGKISYEKLHLSSTFNQSVGLRGVRASPSSPMWFTSSSSSENSDLLPHRKNYVGKVHFDPRKFCGNYCYTGFWTESSIGKEFLRGCRVSWETGEIDWRILKILQKRFEQVKDVTVSNMSLWIETGESSEYKVKTQMSYSWPRLTLPRVVTFPLTSLSNESTIDIPLINPSTSPLVVQALLAHEYGAQWSQFVQGNGVGGNITEGHNVFSLSGVVPTSSQSAEATVIFGQVQKQMIQEHLGLNETSGVMFFLPAGAKFVIRVRFKPMSKHMASTLLLLRNNLTGIETTWVRGRAGTGQLTVGNGVSGSSLLFQLTEKLLQGCQREGSNKYVPAQLTVRRSFIARNIGEIPVEIVFMEVYPLQSSFWWTLFGWSQGDPCEGYGFRILNCRPFTLEPNHTHSIDIAFTPDFTMSRVFRTLRLSDSGGAFNFTLVAMVPSGMLNICASIITRPSWEPLLKYLLLAGILISIFAACLMAYFEAGSVVSSAIVATVRVVPTDSPDGFKNEIKEATTKLDLKTVYDKVDNRFKKHQTATISAKGQGQGQSQPTGLSTSSSASVVALSSSTGGTTTRNRKKKNGNVSLPAQFEFNLTQSKKQGQGQGEGGTKNSSTVSSTVDSDKANNNISSPTTTPPTTLNNKKGVEAVINTKRKGGKGGNNGKSSSSNNKGKNSNGNASSGVQPSKCPPSPKIEEETSSTTTESSNADDLNVNLMSLMDDNNHSGKGKERKTSGKSTGSAESIASSCGGDTAPGSVSASVSAQQQNQKSGGNNSKQKNRKKSLEPKDSNSSACAANAEKGFEEVVWKRSSGNRKKAALSGGSSSSGSRGSVSPKQEPCISLWDPPRPPSSNGLSEFSTTTESFLSQQQRLGAARRSTIHEPTPGGGNSSKQPMPMAMSMTQYQSQAQVTGQGQQSNYGGTFGVRNVNAGTTIPSGGVNRRPGVIGQARPLSSNTPGANGFVSSLLTTMALTMSTSTTSGQNSRQHTPPTRTLSSPSSGNNSSAHASAASAWDILPDNGCDIWNRTTTSSSGSDLGFSSSHSASAFRPSTGGGYGSSQQQQSSGTPTYSPPGGHFTNYSSPNGYSTLGSGSTYASSSPSSSSNPLYSSHGLTFGSNRGTTGQPNRMVVQKPGSATSTTPNSTSDPSFIFNGSLSNELLSNLWHLNANSAAFENPAISSGGGSLAATSVAQVYAQAAAVNAALGVVPPHGYLQRMRSDPNSNPNAPTRQHRPAPLTNGNSWNSSSSSSSSYYSGQEQTNYRHGHGSNNGNGVIDLSKGLHALTSSPSPTRMSENGGWPSPGVSSSAATLTDTAAAFSDWGLTLNLEEASEIWNNSAAAAAGGQGQGTSGSKWTNPSSTYGNGTQGQGNNSVGSLTVGSGNNSASAAPGHRLRSTSPTGSSGVGVTTTPDHSNGFRARAPHDLNLTQSQREVEAGLGFNPFISDIWNQPDNSAPAWNNPYQQQYPSNKE